MKKHLKNQSIKKLLNPCKTNKKKLERLVYIYSFKKLI